VVFDGARAFEGVTPDLELHCARVNASAKKLFLKPTVSIETWVSLAREGIARFDKNAALYIRLYLTHVLGRERRAMGAGP
jgi:branched-chain amino acid aminotransferase